MSAGEATSLVGVDGECLVWRVRVYMPRGRGSLKDYEVRTRSLPRGGVEVAGPAGRPRRLASDATVCGCYWGDDCIHMRALRAHVARGEGLES